MRGRTIFSIIESLEEMRDRTVDLMKHVDVELAKKVGEAYVSRIGDNIKGEEIWNFLSPVVIVAKEKGRPLVYEKIEIDGDKFIDYLSAAKKEYASFAVATDAKELKDACLKRINKGEDISELLGYIKKDKDYADKIRELSGDIVNLIQADNAKKELMDGYFNMLKVVSDGRIVFVHDKMNHLHQVWNTMDNNSSSYIDIYLILAINGIQVAIKSDEELDGIEKILPFYTSVIKIWNMLNSNANSGLKSIMRYCIHKKIHDQGNLTDWVLSKIEDVKKATGCSILEIIEFVEDWGYYKIGMKDKGIDLKAKLPEIDWLKVFAERKGELSKEVLELYGVNVESVPINDFLNKVIQSPYSQSSPKHISETAYWTKVVRILIERGYYANGFTARLKELTKYAIKSLVSGQKFSETSAQMLLLDNAKYDDVKATINDAIKNFINTSTNYNKFKFIAFHKLIEQIPVDSFQDADKFLDKCLFKIINENDVLDVIKANSSFYEDLINKNIASTPNLKNKLEELKTNSQNQLNIINILNKINL